MAIAGKVAITLSTENGGAWSADVTYDRLVAVKHNNSLYISRKVVTNVEPPNNEFWFLALEGYSGADVQELINRMNDFSDTLEAIITGTQQVGNAKTLDGRGAEYFTTKTDVSYLSNYLSEVDERLALLEYMTLQNDFTAPLTVEAGNTLLVDDLGFSIVADWKFKEE